MLKKTFTLIMVLLAVMSTGLVFAGSTTFDISDADQGVVTVNYNVSSSSKYKVMVQQGSDKYYYDLLEKSETFPLQFGNGTYTVAIFKNISGSKYKQVASKKFSVKIEDELTPFLASSQNMNWDDEMDAIKLAQELTKDATTDEEKVDILYNYVVQNISYDYQKARTVATNYVPNIDSTLETGNGICYDYSSLFASMLRSVDVPAKLIKGYKNDISVYHAWNQVYLNGEWVTIDTTYDAGLSAHNMAVDMVKADNLYAVSKFY